MKTKQAPIRGFKALDEAQGIYEAIVSVFGNVDRVGDRVVKGAFAKSLDEWKEKARPIPVIFSHMWDDLNAHIGQVLEAEERDEGLWIKAQLDLDDPYAAKVFKLMQRGTLVEHSFAYDVVREKVQNGANELLELDLIEVGPTLKGVNEETRLLAAKALGLKEGRRNSEKDAERIQSVHDLAGELGADCPAAKSDATRGEKAERADRRKQAVSGSYEHRRDQLQEAVSARYAQADRVHAWITATFEDRAIFALYDWSSEDGGVGYREVTYTVEDGAIVLGEEREVALEMVVTPKAEPTREAGARGREDGRAQGPRISPFAARVAAEIMELSV